MIAFSAPPPWSNWMISGLATMGVIVRPLALPEWIWAVAGAALLVLLGALTPAEAWAGLARGSDVYLFLTGMMLLSELARQEGLFNWLAAHAARRAAGNTARLFALLFGVGTVVTVFLSNDATAVVLTPAIAAAVKAAEARAPLPFLLIPAFVANAASFVLPISNPANLVIYASRVPPLAVWLPRYALPSALAIVATFLVLRATQQGALGGQTIAREVETPPLSVAGRRAALGIGATAAVLIAASALDVRLGLPTFLSGCATALLVLPRSRSKPLGLVRSISWGVLPLVAGLFVLVEALDKTGLTTRFAAALQHLLSLAGTAAAPIAGAAVGFGCNLVNNLPAGLLVGRVVGSASHVPDPVRRAALIGVDLGPNLSVTGSLATILWLAALRRDGFAVSAWTFLKLGALVMPPALLLALGAAALV